MKRKKGVTFLQFTGVNVAEVAELADAKVYIEEENVWPGLVIEFENEKLRVTSGDYIAKHGSKFIVIPEEIINFVFQ